MTSSQNMEKVFRQLSENAIQNSFLTSNRNCIPSYIQESINSGSPYLPSISGFFMRRKKKIIIINYESEENDNLQLKNENDEDKQDKVEQENEQIEERNEGQQIEETNDQMIKFQLWKFVEIGLIADDILVANDLQNSSIFKCVKLDSNEPDAVCSKLYEMMCFYGIPDGFKLIMSNYIDQKFAEEFEISLKKTIKDINKTANSFNFIDDISKYSVKSHFNQEKPPKNFDELGQFELAFVILNGELSEMKLVHLFTANEWSINEEGINLLFTIADKFSKNDDLENVLNSLHLFIKMEEYKVKPERASNKNNKPRESALQKELKRLNEITLSKSSNKNFKSKIEMKKYESEEESSESSYFDESSESEDEKNKKPNKSSSTINKKVLNGTIKEKKKTQITIDSPISSQSSSATLEQENISKTLETISEPNSNKTSKDGRSSRLSNKLVC